MKTQLALLLAAVVIPSVPACTQTLLRKLNGSSGEHYGTAVIHAGDIEGGADPSLRVHVQIDAGETQARPLLVVSLRALDSTLTLPNSRIPVKGGAFRSNRPCMSAVSRSGPRCSCDAN